MPFDIICINSLKGRYTGKIHFSEVQGMEDTRDKSRRILDIYASLVDGKTVYKKELAQKYEVNERTIQRDFDDVRDFLDKKAAETGVINDLIYDRSLNGYRLEYSNCMKLENSEILAISKILLDSRAFTKKEMSSMLHRMIDCCVPKENQKLVAELIGNEEFHYIELQHKTVFIDKMWEIGQAIQQSRYIEIEYQRMKDRAVVKRKVKPVSIMFSEYYFYMAAFLDDKDESKQHFDVINDSFPTIYRIDRIKGMKVLEEHFYIPYKGEYWDCTKNPSPQNGRYAAPQCTGWHRGRSRYAVKSS